MVVQEYHKNAFWGLLSDGSMAKESALLHRQQQLKNQATSPSLTASDRISLQNELDDIKVEIRSYYSVSDNTNLAEEPTSEEDVVASIANIHDQASQAFNSQANMLNADVLALLA